MIWKKCSSQKIRQGLLRGLFLGKLVWNLSWKVSVQDWNTFLIGNRLSKDWFLYLNLMSSNLMHRDICMSLFLVMHLINIGQSLFTFHKCVTASLWAFYTLASINCPKRCILCCLLIFFQLFPDTVSSYLFVHFIFSSKIFGFVKSLNVDWI